MQDKDLNQFIERIFSISAPTMNVLGRGIPGMSGGAAATQGALSSGGDVTYKLKKQAIDFARAYKDSNPDLQKMVKNIEALILSEETLSVITQKEANTLIDQLYDLVDAKK